MSDRTCIDTDKGRLLHAYELGLLAEKDAEKFEIHLLECETCLAAAQDFAARALLLMHGHKIKHKVDRLMTEEAGRARERKGLRDILRPDAPIMLRPVVLLIVILLLIYPAYLGIRSSRPADFRPVQAVNLIPLRSLSAQEFVASRQADGLITFLIPEANPGDRYVLQLLSGSDRVVFTDSSYSDFDSLGIGHILFPREKMTPGSYTLYIRDALNPAARTQEYEFYVK